MNASDFLALQDIDSAIDAIAHRKQRLPEAAAQKDARAEVDRIRAEGAAAQRQIDEAQAIIDGAEREAADLTAKRNRLEAQLKTVIAPREAEALMSEINTIAQHRSELDDRELEALDTQAQGEAALAAAVAQLPAAEAVLAVTTATLDEVTADLDAEAASLAAQRTAAAAALDDAAMSRYTRLRQQFGGVAVARLQGSHCSGCHMDLSPMELDQVRSTAADQLAECPQCGRFMAR